jgi:hypothetical protein
VWPYFPFTFRQVQLKNRYTSLGKRDYRSGYGTGRRTDPKFCLCYCFTVVVRVYNVVLAFITESANPTVRGIQELRKNSIQTIRDNADVHLCFSKEKERWTGTLSTWVFQRWLCVSCHHRKVLRDRYPKSPSTLCVGSTTAFPNWLFPLIFHLRICRWTFDCFTETGWRHSPHPLWRGLEALFCKPDS